MTKNNLKVVKSDNKKQQELKEKNKSLELYESIKSDSGKIKAVAKDRERYVQLLRNQYWVLMTRGMRSLHIYSENPEVRELFSKHATQG